MAGTWDELVQQIKDRLDIVDVISEQVVLKKRGNTVIETLKEQIKYGKEI